MHKVVYDIETFPNCFLFGAKNIETGDDICFEYSWRLNDMEPLFFFLDKLKGESYKMVGFNNLGFDYPIIHWLIDHREHVLSGSITPYEIYLRAKEIIECDWDDRFNYIVWDRDQHIPQIDLFKIHHFDNPSRATSLKVLEFNMRRDRVRDLPFKPDRVLDWHEMDTLRSYLMDDDIDATTQFMNESLSQIEFREKLSETYDDHYMNCSDPKIGEKFITMKLEEMILGFDKKDRTHRKTIELKEVIFDYIRFDHPEFNRVLNWFKSQSLKATKGAFENVHCTVNGFQFDFGTGGIHGSIDSTIVYSDDDYVLYDWDVASYYPNLAIANRLFPEHLSEQFCDIYKDVFEQRRQYKKGTPENAMLKLALNGVYGDSNNKYSPFYDPKYTMSITINGQLLLCLLAQYLLDIPNLTMIQINTDGLTVKCPRQYIQTMKDICKWWENYTCLELESVEYNRMFIRDVNNYIGEYVDGGVKRKGAYEYKLTWSQNHSALVVPKAAEAALVHGKDIREFIINHDDIFDFMLRTKVGRSDNLIISDTAGNTRELQKITRYYVSNDGGALTKISPPTKGYQVGQWKRATKLTDHFYKSVIKELKESCLKHNVDIDGPAWGDLDTLGLPWDERINTKNRSKYVERKTNINSGYLVTPCNDIKQARRDNINFEYYIAEAEKLVKPLRD